MQKLQGQMQKLQGQARINLITRAIGSQWRVTLQTRKPETTKFLFLNTFY